MIWSSLKIVVFVFAVAGLTWGAGQLSESGAGLRLFFGATEYSLTAVQAAAALAILVLIVWIGLKLAGLAVAFVRFANGDETALSRYFDRRSQQKGFEALSEGLTALAAGDGRLAMAKATKAERHLQRPELTNLITAQAAEATGDPGRAEAAYRRLLRDDRTRFVGIRGLLKQKLAAGDGETALKLAEMAFALKPGHAETGDLLLHLQAREEDWSGARKTLAEKTRQGVLPRDVHRRRDAVLALSEARDVFRQGTTIEARERAIEANRLSPDLIPAAVMAAQAYITEGKAKSAERVLRKAWSVRPHPDLAATYATIAPEENPETRRKRFRGLLKISPDHPESRMLSAELNIAAQDFAAARAALGDLAETSPTTRSLTLMAAIERGEGGEDHVVRAWLTRAVTAPRGPQWVCENCGKVHGIWGPVCDNCEAFDTIAWGEPKEAELTMPGAAETLPVLASRPAPVEPDEPDEVEAVAASDEDAPEAPKQPAPDTPAT